MPLLRWARVEGGLCMYGDYHRPRIVDTLLWTVTPITHAQVSSITSGGNPDEPLTCLDYEEANAIAAQLGGRLPTAAEWEWAASGPCDCAFPWGFDPWNSTKANLRNSGLGRAVAVGSFPDGNTRDGLMDMAGNVWEWTSTLIPGAGAIVKGGSYNSTVLEATNKFLNAAPVELRSGGIGLRIVKEIP